VFSSSVVFSLWNSEVPPEWVVKLFFQLFPVKIFLFVFSFLFTEQRSPAGMDSKTFFNFPREKFLYVARPVSHINTP
jgi:hypothetical protein